MGRDRGKRIAAGPPAAGLVAGIKCFDSDSAPAERPRSDTAATAFRHSSNRVPTQQRPRSDTAAAAGRLFEEVGAEEAGAGEGLVVLPLGDAGFVAAEEDVGDAPAVVVGRAGVDRRLEEVVLE